MHTTDTDTDDDDVLSKRVFAVTNVALGIVALLHAAFTWPMYATLALFAGGAVIAFTIEVAALNLGWIKHHVGPKFLGVPLYVLFGWTGLVYVAFRVALLVTDGWTAIGVAAVVATTYDVLVDHRGVAAGHWTYADDFPGPRYRGVPVLTFVGWIAVSCITAVLAVPFL